MSGKGSNICVHCHSDAMGKRLRGATWCTACGRMKFVKENHEVLPEYVHDPGAHRRGSWHDHADVMIAYDPDLGRMKKRAPVVQCVSGAVYDRQDLTDDV